MNCKRTYRFSSLPSVLVEASLSLLNVPDLLHCSEASKDLRKYAISVLGKQIKTLSFRLLPRHLVTKDIPVSFFKMLSSLHSFGPLEDLLQLECRCLAHFSLEERLAIHWACPQLELLLLDGAELEDVDCATFLPPAMSIRRLPYCINKLPYPLLQYADTCCPKLDHIDVDLFDLSDEMIGIVERLLDRCSSLLLRNQVTCGAVEISLLEHLGQLQHLTIFAPWKPVVAVQIVCSIGVEKLRASLLTLNADASTVYTFFPSDRTPPSSSYCWPLLQTLALADCSDSVLETVVSHCPSLTDLAVSAVAHGVLLPVTCGLSERSLDSLAAHLLRLGLNIENVKFQELVTQLSLRPAQHIATLQLETRARPADLQCLKEALPRFRCLTSLSYFGDESDCSPMLDGLAALPTATARQLRVLDLHVHLLQNWTALLSLLQQRPLLDCLRIVITMQEVIPTTFLTELQRMVREERAKGSGRLDLSDFVLDWPEKVMCDPLKSPHNHSFDLTFD